MRLAVLFLVILVCADAASFNRLGRLLSTALATPRNEKTEEPIAIKQRGAHSKTKKIKVAAAKKIKKQVSVADLKSSTFTDVTVRKVDKDLQSTMKRQAKFMKAQSTVLSVMTFILMRVIHKLNYKDKNTLLYSRLAFATYLALFQACIWFIQRQINQRDDHTVLATSGNAGLQSLLQSLGGGNPLVGSLLAGITGNDVTKPHQTVHSHDLAQLATLSAKLRNEFYFVTVVHFLLRYQAVVLVVPLMGLSALLKHRLVWLHVFRSAAVGELERPFRGQLELFAQSLAASKIKATPDSVPVVGTTATAAGTIPVQTKSVKTITTSSVTPPAAHKSKNTHKHKNEQASEAEVDVEQEVEEEVEVVAGQDGQALFEEVSVLDQNQHQDQDPQESGLDRVEDVNGHDGDNDQEEEEEGEPSDLDEGQEDREDDLEEEERTGSVEEQQAVEEAAAAEKKVGVVHVDFTSGGHSSGSKDSSASRKVEVGAAVAAASGVHHTNTPLDTPLEEAAAATAGVEDSVGTDIDESDTDEDTTAIEEDNNDDVDDNEVESEDEEENEATDETDHEVEEEEVEEEGEELNEQDGHEEEGEEEEDIEDSDDTKQSENLEEEEGDEMEEDHQEEEESDDYGDADLLDAIDNLGD